MKASLRNRNLFIRAHEAKHGSNFDRIGSGWEDTLTDLFAFLLAADDESRESVIREILGAEAEPAATIDTQAGYATGCPDLQIELASGRLLLLEHKVDASLGERQLERYLEIKDRKGTPARVALICRRPTDIPSEVLDNPKYLRPTDGAHWFWQDVCSWLPPATLRFGAEWVRRCFREYLDLLGLCPPVIIGKWQELLNPDLEFNPVRYEFGRRLSLIREYLSERGFSITGDSGSGLFAFPSDNNSPWRHITVGPARARRDQMAPEYSDVVETAVFRVALVYDGAEPAPDAMERFAQLEAPVVDPNGFRWYPVAPHPMSTKRIRLSMVTNLGPLLDNDARIAKRLFAGFKTAYSGLVGEL